MQSNYAKTAHVRTNVDLASVACDHGRSVDVENVELYCLPDVDVESPKIFDAVSRALFTPSDDNDFLWAHKTWGVGADLLYRCAQRFGLERLKDTIMDVSNKANVTNKGAYLNICLRNMK